MKKIISLIIAVLFAFIFFELGFLYHIYLIKKVPSSDNTLHTWTKNDQLLFEQYRGFLLGIQLDKIGLKNKTLIETKTFFTYSYILDNIQAPCVLTKNNKSIYPDICIKVKDFQNNPDILIYKFIDRPRITFQKKRENKTVQVSASDLKPQSKIYVTSTHDLTKGNPKNFYNYDNTLDLTITQLQ